MTAGTDDTPIELVDAHCHLDLYGENEGIVIEEIESRRVHVIAVTNAPSVFFHTRDVARIRKYVHPAVGLHPELVASHGHQLEQMWPHLAETRFVGEIGLDYVTSDSRLRQRQREVFSQILARCADYRDKVLTVHSRRSASDVLTAIGYHFPGTVILHWFSGSKEELDRAVSAGCWFSVNLAMFGSKRGLDLVRRIPMERVLTESDGPFVQVEGRASRPTDCEKAVAALGTLWQVPLGEVARCVAENFRTVLGASE